MKKLIYAILAMASIGAKAEVVTYPAGDGVLTSSDYTVEVRQGGEWQPVAVYPVSVFNVDKAKDAVERASMAYFDFDGPVEVRLVHHLGAVDKAAVRPLSRGIVPELSGDTISFSLTGSENLSVEINGDRFHNLHLFANPVDANRPTAKELKKLKKNKKFVYFAPGVHQLPGDTMRVESGTTVYVDGGARVYGAIIADGVRDVKIYGRGEVHPVGRGSGVNIRRSKNVEVDGLVTTQLPVGGSDSVRVSNVKAISSYNWGDGMNVFSSSNVHYDRVFCRNSDDCSTAYASTQGYKGSSRNVLVENSVLWADVAHPINVGGHGDPAGSDTVENVTYRNIDILDHAEKQLDYQGCMAINPGDNVLVRNIVFEDIRVEDIRRGQLLNVRIGFNKKYCVSVGRGVDNVLFKNISYNGTNSNLSIIAGYDEDHKLSGITFDNLVINGVRITDDMPGKPRWYKTGDMARIFIGEHVDGVVFK